MSFHMKLSKSGMNCTLNRHAKTCEWACRCTGRGVLRTVCAGPCATLLLLTAYSLTVVQTGMEGVGSGWDLCDFHAFQHYCKAAGPSYAQQGFCCWHADEGQRR